MTDRDKLLVKAEYLLTSLIVFIMLITEAVIPSLAPHMPATICVPLQAISSVPIGVGVVLACCNQLLAKQIHLAKVKLSRVGDTRTYFGKKREDYGSKKEDQLAPRNAKIY
jgi:hypothetical protein